MQCPFVMLFEKAFSILILATLSIGSLIVFFDRTPNLFPHLLTIWQKIKSLFIKKPKEEEMFFGETIPSGELQEEEPEPIETVKSTNKNIEEEFTIPLPKRKPSAGYIPPPL